MVGPFGPFWARESLELLRLELGHAEDAHRLVDRSREGCRSRDDAVVVQELEWEAKEATLELKSRRFGVVLLALLDGAEPLDARRSGRRRLYDREARDSGTGGELGCVERVRSRHDASGLAGASLDERRLLRLA